MSAMRTLGKLFGREVRAIHCAGVGGMGVGPLAIYLARLGYTVTGEDDALTDAMRAHLQNANITITAPGEIPVRCDLLACSTAISSKHPAALAAAARNIPTVRRGELLAEVIRDKKLVAICGSHGKTTTTAMLITALRRANFSAGYVLGGLFADSALAPADIGATDYVVAEIDESDGTIEKFPPEITVATNLDWDHPDHYRDRAAIEATFHALFARTRHAVVSSEKSIKPAGTITASVFSFGILPTAEYRYTITHAAGNGQTLALANQFPIDTATIRALGEFNAANAAAALAAAHLMGAQLSPDLLATYPGVRRRQGILHATDNLTVVEDYAHHPAEITALLTSLRAQIPATGRLLVAFQPHRYSRTAQFKAEFASALSIADRAYLIDVYSAGEAPVAGGTSSDLYAQLRAVSPATPVIYRAQNTNATLTTLARDVAPGDWVAFVGAGDIDISAREWLTLAAKYEEDSASYWNTATVALRGSVSAQAKIRVNEPLAPKTTMRAGGPARIYAEPATEDDVGKLTSFARSRAIPVLMLGRGSNLLVPDEGIDALVISLANPAFQNFTILPGGLVECGAGIRLKNLCGLAAAAGLAGFEFLEGIPGNLGGALRMNAGAMGGEMFNLVESIRVMTHTGEIRTLRPAELGVAYRNCAELARGTIALSAILRPGSAGHQPGIPKTPAEINALIETYRAKRHASQPRESSAGCIFKNPPNDSAGRLIDAAGLKGTRIGGAEVSSIHANFIINRDGATTTDIIELVRLIRARVAEKFSVTLTPEVMLYGANWSDFL